MELYKNHLWTECTTYSVSDIIYQIQFHCCIAPEHCMIYGGRVVWVNAWQDATVAAAAAAAAIGDRHPADPSQVPACQHRVFAIHHSLIPSPHAGDAYWHPGRPAPNLAVICPPRLRRPTGGGASAHDKSIRPANDLWMLAPSRRAHVAWDARRPWLTGRCSPARIGCLPGPHTTDSEHLRSL